LEGRAGAVRRLNAMDDPKMRNERGEDHKPDGETGIAPVSSRSSASCTFDQKRAMSPVKA